MLFQVPQPVEPTAPPPVLDPNQGPYNGPQPHIYPNLYSPGAPLHDPRVHGKNQQQRQVNSSTKKSISVNNDCFNMTFIFI